MKVLSIGNSFSHDAQRYLYELACASGDKFKTVNLYIGGCTLRTHYLNMLDDNRAYDFQFNGKSTGLKVSIREVLASDEWDVVTLQQASHRSFDSASYTPYIEALADFVRKYCPHAKLLIQETWSYEAGSFRLENAGFATPRAMYEKLHEAYLTAARSISADGIIPSGTAMQIAQDMGITVHRDTFHASLGFGRLLLANVWYKTLTGNIATANIPTDEPVTPDELDIIQSITEKACETK